MKALFDKTSFLSATQTTAQYSTSFSSAVKLLHPSIRQDIYNIYGFVRVADEIVDSFEGYPQEEMLDRFEAEYAFALKNGLSTDLIINAFQHTVKKHNIDQKLVQAFLKSMRADLTKSTYTTDEEIAEYIYGSADVVGLMCLKVFVNGNKEEYNKLEASAQKLGSAFQKINFLRDLQHDINELDRVYFPGVDLSTLDDKSKRKLLDEIKAEFNDAYEGIIRLPNVAKLGVYVAYKYYLQLLKKIDKTPTKTLKTQRVRVSNVTKSWIVCKAIIRCKLNICKQ